MSEINLNTLAFQHSLLCLVTINVVWSDSNRPISFGPAPPTPPPKLPNAKRSLCAGPCLGPDWVNPPFPSSVAGGLQPHFLAQRMQCVMLFQPSGIPLSLTTGLELQ